MKTRLTDIKINTGAIIKTIEDNTLITKMFEFGLLPGTKITIINKAPFDGPISVLVDDSIIALREKEAHFILMEN
ncbi:MAG TPA: ferrous iron transport protein A [Crocinitomix sp.]|nr:ferrous iron transport protein A [Crocinitomix sp.]